MHEKVIRGIMLILILAIPLFIYLSVYSIVGFDLGLYNQLMDDNGVEVNNKEELAAGVVGYLQANQELPSEFTKREADHLKDVKIVMENVNLFHGFLFGVILAGLALLYKKDRGRIRWVLMYSGAITVLIPLLLLVLPFEAIFDLFHQPFFEVGTWVFEPNDLLIKLFPLGFFNDIAIRIFGYGLIAGVIMALGAYFSR